MNYKAFIPYILFPLMILIIINSVNFYLLGSSKSVVNATDSLIVTEFYEGMNYLSDNDLVIGEKNLEDNLLLYDSSDSVSLKILYNIERTLAFSKIKYSKFDINNFLDLSINKNFILELYKNKNRVITFILSNTDLIGDLENLMKFIDNGGTVVFPQKLNLDNFTFKDFLSKYNVVFLNEKTESDEIVFLSNILIDSKDKLYKGKIFNEKVNNVSLDKNSFIHIKNIKKTPLLWKTSAKKGNIIFVNSEILAEKYNRGLISGIFSLSKEALIYPIFNSKVVHIDDFPCPFPDGFDKKIKARYNRDIKSFFRDIWWPDIIKSAKLYNIKYTGYFIETYENSVNPPFNIDNPNIRYVLNEYAYDLLKNDGELGLHGYNHQPLDISGVKSITEGYKNWGNEKNIILALKEALKFISESFPNYKIKAYVPPSNILTEPGREALKKSMDDLLVISALKYGDVEESAYYQEFEVKEDGIVEFPRLTSGYIDTTLNSWININSISSTGIFSHFIHVDDMLDVERSMNKSWHELQIEYYKYMKKLNQNYNWLIPMTSSEAALKFKDYMAYEFSSDIKNNKIYCKTSGSNFKNTYILKTEKTIGTYTNCTLKKICENTYMIQSTSDKFTIDIKQK